MTDNKPASSGPPITSSAIFFITGGLITVGLLYRVFRLLTRRHLKEAGFKLLTIPICDISLLCTWALFIEHMVFSIRISEKSFTIQQQGELGDLRDSFRREITILNASNVALHWICKVPLFALFFLGLQSFSPALWLRVFTIIAPGIHTLAFLAAWFLEIFSLANGVVATAFNALSDVMLLVLAFTFMFNPVIIIISTKRQWWWGWVFVVIGIASLVTGIVRFFFSHPYAESETAETRRIERLILWTAVETATAVVACNAPTFRRLFKGEKGEQGEQETEQRDVEFEVSASRKEWNIRNVRRQSTYSEEGAPVWG